MDKNKLIAQALIQQQQQNPDPFDVEGLGIPPAAAASPLVNAVEGGGNPFVPNQVLEDAAAPANIQQHPLVTAIMNRLPFMNMVRNRSNKQVIDPELYGK